jgi:inhibitor of KinA
MEITPLGDSALLIRVAEDFETAPGEALAKVLEAKQLLEVARIPGVIELAPAYTTIGLFYDSVRATQAGAPVDDLSQWFGEQIRSVLSKKSARAGIETRIVEIPVCYEREFALDIDDVAGHTGLEAKDVVDLHCSAEYRVHCLGFTPGFPFLGGLPRKLGTPRKSVPRKEIPAGSVAIGGTQTGIYPIKSPGGWNVIGRTPLRLFDPEKDPSALLRAGDRVRFRAITREQFERSTT